VTNFNYFQSEDISICVETGHVSHHRWSSGTVLAIKPKTDRFKPGQGQWIFKVDKDPYDFLQRGSHQSHVVRSCKILKYSSESSGIYSHVVKSMSTGVSEVFDYTAVYPRRL
jgi:hypothetical protein